MFVENLDKIDESFHDQFVEHEKDGVKGFIDKDSKSAIDTLFHVKGEKKDYLEKLKSVGAELDSYKSTEQERIDKAKADALVEAKSKGEVDNIERLYQEKMADLERRTEQRVRSEVEQEYTIKELKGKAQLELTDLVHGLKPKDDFAKRLIQDHLKQRQVVEDGKIIYLNEDGSASSLDKAGLLKELQESPMFKSLTSYTPPTVGGGNIGGNGSGASSSHKTQAETWYK